MQNQTYFIAFHLANSAYHRWNDSSSLEIQPRYLLYSNYRAGFLDRQVNAINWPVFLWRGEVGKFDIIRNCINICRHDLIGEESWLSWRVLAYPCAVFTFNPASKLKWSSKDNQRIFVQICLYPGDQRNSLSICNKFWQDQYRKLPSWSEATQLKLRRLNVTTSSLLPFYAVDWKFITAKASSFLICMAQKVRHTSLQMDIPTIKFNSRTPSSSPALGSRSAALIRQRSRSLCGLDEVHDQNNTPKRNKKCKCCHHYFLPFVDVAAYLFVCLLYCHCLLCTIIVFFFKLDNVHWQRSLVEYVLFSLRENPVRVL